ncbi:hypothetical protein HanPI659440_Chr08g0286251 [Helianthus annuus]|nr:hypothetical protein HanPI659440_Chr08g0286251 [Helianthus annuus]
MVYTLHGIRLLHSILSVCYCGYDRRSVVAASRRCSFDPLGIMWTWTQARKTNGSRGDKEANAKMDAQGK